MIRRFPAYAWNQQAKRGVHQIRPRVDAILPKWIKDAEIELRSARMSDYQDILYGVKDHVATIAINRPNKLNAFTQKTIYEWEDALRRAEADRDVGVIVFTGVGDRAFSSGGDVNWEKQGGLCDRTQS